MKATHTPGQTDFTDPVSQMKAAQELHSWGENVEVIRSAQDKHDKVMRSNAELLCMLERLLDEVMMDERVFSKIAPLTLEQSRNAIANARGQGKGGEE